MTEQEQIQYLANIYHVARADGRVAADEDRLIEHLANGIGAGYLETRKALDLSAEKDFEVVFPARFSDRVRNLEDMLLLAYSDRQLHEMEKRVIVDFARKIDMAAQQVKLIQQEAKVRLRDLQS